MKAYACIDAIASIKNEIASFADDANRLVSKIKEIAMTLKEAIGLSHSSYTDMANMLNDSYTKAIIKLGDKNNELSSLKSMLNKVPKEISTKNGTKANPDYQNVLKLIRKNEEFINSLNRLIDKININKSMVNEKIIKLSQIMSSLEGINNTLLGIDNISNNAIELKYMLEGIIVLINKYSYLRLYY